MKSNRKQLQIISTQEMVNESIEFLKKHEPAEGYFLGFSGGKDSITTLELCKMAGVEFQPFYSFTGIDPPELVQFIKKEYPSIKWLYPKYSFFEGVVKKFPPMRTKRWCCSILKEHYIKTLPYRIMGIRAEESINRANRGEISKQGRYTNLKPIFEWTGYHVWDFIESNSLKYPSLYDEGFERIGCMICPFILSPNMKKLNQHKDRWPKFYKAFEHAVKRWFDFNKKDKREPFEEYLIQYYKGEMA